MALDDGRRTIGEARTAIEAVRYVGATPVDVLIVDVGLPGDMDGLILVKHLRAMRQFELPRIIVITGRHEPLTAERARRLEQRSVTGFLVRQPEKDRGHVCQGADFFRDGFCWTFVGIC